MAIKALLEALLIDWVRRNVRRGERTAANGQRIRGQVSRDPTSGRWNWWVEMWVDVPTGVRLSFSGWHRRADGMTLTRLGAHARVRVALRAYEHGTEFVR